MAKYSALPASKVVILMDEIDKKIINLLQQGFPISERPFQEVADQLQLTEAELIERIQLMKDSNVLTRFGPLYNAEQMGGALTLAAVQAPEQAFDQIAETINAFPEVAHNYARDHTLNMWFVIATDNLERIDQVIQQIQLKTGLPVFNLPKINEYFVGLKLEV